jgi:CheY-like chemotaxis protein
VKRILTFSRRQEPARRPAQLAHIVGETARLIRATLPATVELDADSTPVGPEILVDAHQLEQVLMNLAANAAYAMREKGGRLTIRTRLAEIAAPHVCALVTLPPGPYLAWEVDDTGPGIPPSLLTKIFDPFFTTKPVGDGSGLGLAIAHNIISGHGGGIEVTSSPSGGARFTVYLPLLKPDAVMADLGSQLQTIPAPSRGQGEIIAVIDDEAEVRAMIVSALLQLGYFPRPFAAADQFLAEFTTAPFAVDLVLTDQTMPRLTGLQLAQRLREDGQVFPVVVASGHSPNLAPGVIEALGHTALLEKPFTLAQLAATARRMLDLRRPPA